MSFNLHPLVRDNIRRLKPYSSARHEFQGAASVYLDANENAYGSPGHLTVTDTPENFNRYPDPLQWQLKFQLARIKGVPAENIFIGNGSDEVIDLAFRIFCNPARDNVIICPPTYGMYRVSADINEVEVREVPLTPGFQLNVPAILEAVDERTKLLFICSPNNPTGNSMNRQEVEWLLNSFPGIILVDEAYINYARQHSFIRELTEYPNLVVMQTLSKAWGLAALRLGIGFASMDIIDLFNRVKPPYNINEASQKLALAALQETEAVNAWIRQSTSERTQLERALSGFSFVQKVYPSDANFILVKVTDADRLYGYLAAQGVIVRNRSREPLCEQCLRITIGTPDENAVLLKHFKSFPA